MIRHIFFDLDHTIWDFDRNAQETLTELYAQYRLQSLGLSSCSAFIECYTENNQQLWADYHLGRISKEELRSARFRKTFLDMGVAPELVPEAFEADYVRMSPVKTNLFAGSETVLSYLQQKYTLHIISNGFKETTLTKMDRCNLNRYFTQVIISEDAGCNKPDPAIFRYALEKAGAEKAESVMIGDSLEADIRGAQDFGIRAIYFNPADKPLPGDVRCQIRQLNELMNIF